MLKIFYEVTTKLFKQFHFGIEIVLSQKNLEGWMVRVWDGDCWDPSQRFWDLEWSSQQNPTRWNIRRSRTKLPPHPPSKQSPKMGYNQFYPKYILSCLVWCTNGLVFNFPCTILKIDLFSLYYPGYYLHQELSESHWNLIRSISSSLNNDQSGSFLPQWSIEQIFPDLRYVVSCSESSKSTS